MTVKDSIFVFSVAVVTCFDSHLFASHFSMLYACECHKYTNDAVSMNSYDLPEKISSTGLPGYGISFL